MSGLDAPFPHHTCNHSSLTDILGFAHYFTIRYVTTLPPCCVRLAAPFLQTALPAFPAHSSLHPFTFLPVNLKVEGRDLLQSELESSSKDLCCSTSCVLGGYTKELQI